MVFFSSSFLREEVKDDIWNAGFLSWLKIHFLVMTGSKTFCNNKRCRNSPKYGNCEYCNGTGIIIKDDSYFYKKGEECVCC
jgi:Ribonuclease G/E